jgi:CBS domain-containing protein
MRRLAIDQGGTRNPIGCGAAVRKGRVLALDQAACERPPAAWMAFDPEHSMSKSISSIMQREVLSVGMDDTVQAVQAFMDELRLTWVPVVTPEGGVAGVISAADLLRFCSTKQDPASIRAWQLCTYKPIGVGVDASIEAVAALMVQRQVHHVVVMSGDRLEGVVSSLDIVKCMVPAAGG